MTAGGKGKRRTGKKRKKRTGDKKIGENLKQGQTVYNRATERQTERETYIHTITQRHKFRDKDT